MIKLLKNSFYDLKMTTQQKDSRNIFLLVSLFLVCNAVKLATFNVILLGDTGRTVDFVFKTVFSLAISAVYVTLALRLQNKWIFLASYILQSVYLFANLSYYLYFRSYLHIIQWVTLLGEGFTVAKNLIIPIGFEMAVILLDVPLFVLLFVKYKKSTETRTSFVLPSAALVLIAICTFVFSLFFYNTYKTVVEKAEPAAINSETVSVKRYGTVVNEFVNIFTNSSDEERVAKIKFGKEISAEQTKTEFPNIVYIQVESMDANIVSKQWDGKYVMPFMASLRENSIYYPYTLSYHMGGGTSDCEFSAINSVESIPGFPAMKLDGFDFSNSFVWRLKNNGYNTLAFHGNKAKFFTRDEAYPKMGYDKFYDIAALGLKESGWGASDADLLNSTYRVLKEQQEPFYAHIITMTSHEPFTNIEKCGDFNWFDDVENTKARNYMNSFRYVDEQLENFITEIKKDKPNTYFIIFGDHMSGIETDEYSMCGYIYENKLFEFVPLFIITPDNQKYEETEAAASFRDFAPTVLNISGVKYTVFSDGQDLLDFGKLPVTVSLREGNYNRKDIYEKAKEKQESDDLKAKNAVK